MLTTLAPFAGALLLLVAILAPGHLLARLWIGLDRRNPLVLLLSELALGASAWVVVLFALASVGLYQRAVLLVLVLAGVSCAVPAWRLRKRDEQTPGAPAEAAAAADGVSIDDVSGQNAQETAASPRLARVAEVALGVAVAVILGALFIHTLRPDISWDTNVYHLTLPRLFLEHGGFYAVPQNVYSHWPLATQLLYGAALALQGPVTAKLVHFGFGLATLGCLAVLTGRQAAAFAVALFLFNPVVLYEMRIAYVDLASAFFLSMALVAWKQAESSGSERMWRLIALCCGMLVAIKLNGLFGPISLLLALAVVTYRTRGTDAQPPQTARLTLRRSALVLGICFTFGVVWLLKSYLLTGNPVYPLFWETFGGPEWSAQLAEQHSRWQQSIGRGRDLTDYLLLPLRVITESDRGYDNFDGAISRVWLLALPVALLGAWRDRLSRVCVLTVLALFVSWSATSQQTRFLIPALALLSIASARELSHLLASVAANLRASIQLAAAAGLAVALFMASWVYVRQVPGLVGDLVIHGDQLPERVEHPVYRFIDDQLPKDARLLLLGTNHGFYVRRPFVADSFFEASQIIDRFRHLPDRAGAREELGRMGITHVLIDSRASQMPYPPSLSDALNDPAFSQPIHRSQDGRFIVAALRTAAGS